MRETADNRWDYGWGCHSFRVLSRNMSRGERNIMRKNTFLQRVKKRGNIRKIVRYNCILHRCKVGLVFVVWFKSIWLVQGLTLSAGGRGGPEDSAKALVQGLRQVNTRKIKPVFSNAFESLWSFRTALELHSPVSAFHLNLLGTGTILGWIINYWPWWEWYFRRFDWGVALTSAYHVLSSVQCRRTIFLAKPWSSQSKPTVRPDNILLIRRVCSERHTCLLHFNTCSRCYRSVKRYLTTRSQKIKQARKRKIRC